MYGSGAEIGTLPTQEVLLILLVPHPARAACAVAAVGASERSAAVLRTGTTAAPAFAATTSSASASPSSQFNDWKSNFLGGAALEAEQHRKVHQRSEDGSDLSDIIGAPPRHRRAREITRNQRYDRYPPVLESGLILPECAVRRISRTCQTCLPRRSGAKTGQTKLVRRRRWLGACGLLGGGEQCGESRCLLKNQ